MGLNGSGKTTVVRHLAGFLKADSGTVTIDGQPVIDNEELKARVLVIPDDIYFFRGYSLKDMKAYNKKIYKTWDDEILQQMPDDFGMDVSMPMGKF